MEQQVHDLYGMLKLFGACTVFVKIAIQNEAKQK
jgi:hypothetical protein